MLCQALDIRALQKEFKTSIAGLLTDVLRQHIFNNSPSDMPVESVSALSARILPSIYVSLDSTTTMDAPQRLAATASAMLGPLFEELSKSQLLTSVSTESISALRQSFTERGTSILNGLRKSYLYGQFDIPHPVANGSHSFNPRARAAHLLGRTRPVYEFIRLDLNVPMHGLENLEQFQSSENHPNIGQNVSLIYEAIRDGRMHEVLVKVFGVGRNAK